MKKRTFVGLCRERNGQNQDESKKETDIYRIQLMKKWIFVGTVSGKKRTKSG